MKINKDFKKVTITHGALATALGVSRQYVTKLAKEGVFVKDPNDANAGLFVLESLKNYYSIHAKPQSKEVETQEVNYMEEKAKHEAASRKLAELKLAKAEGRALDARIVEMVLIEDFSVIRTQLLGLPAKVIPRLENKSRAEMDNILTKEIEEALVGLSEISPASFMKEEIDDEDDT